MPSDPGVERVSISQSPVIITVFHGGLDASQGRSVLGPNSTFLFLHVEQTRVQLWNVRSADWSVQEPPGWLSNVPGLALLFPPHRVTNFLPFFPLLLPLLSAYSNHHFPPPNPPSFTRFSPTFLPSFLQPGAVCLLNSSLSHSLARKSFFLSHPHQPRSPRGLRCKSTSLSQSRYETIARVYRPYGLLEFIYPLHCVASGSISSFIFLKSPPIACCLVAGLDPTRPAHLS